MFQTNEIQDTCHALDVFIEGVPHLEPNLHANNVENMAMQ